ncbi:MAG: ComEC/Rec2 family competence protein [Elusimicrobiota bacterium]
MPLSYFRRPLAVATFLYIVVLIGLQSRGFFRLESPPRLRPYARIPSVRVEGLVVSGFSPKRPGDRYWLRVDRTAGRIHEPVGVMAYLPRADPSTALLRPGRRVGLEGRLRLPRWPRNPGAFDEKAFLERRGAVFVLHARKVEALRGRAPPSWLPWAAGESVHRSVHAYLYRRFPETTASILEGILLGYRGPLPAALKRDIQRAGVMHLLTPSGAKVTLLLAWVLLASGLLGLRPGARLAAAALMGGFYLLVVGAEPPYTRAYFMALVVYASYLIGRESGGFQALVLSALGTLLVSPRSLFCAGYQLTYLAMLGILIALPRWRPPRHWPPPLSLAARIFSISFVVQLMLWPTFAHFFACGSVVGLLVNIVMVPGSGIIAGSGFLAWAASLAPIPIVESLLAWAAGALADAFRVLCVFAAGLPGAAVDLRPMSPAEIAAYYLGAFAVLVLPRRRPAAGFAAAAALVWMGSLAHAGLAPERVSVLFLSQRGARAALVTFPGRRHVLVDAGATPSVYRDVFRRLGVRRLESVWVTGMEPSRWKGLGGLPDLVGVGSVLLPTGFADRACAEGSRSCSKRLVRTLRVVREAGIVPGILRPDSRERRGPAVLSASPVELARAGVRVSWKVWGAAVSTMASASAGGEETYCIMTNPEWTAPAGCPSRRRLDIRWDGAVRVTSDGKKVAITAQKQGRSLGGPIP